MLFFPTSVLSSRSPSRSPARRTNRKDQTPPRPPRARRTRRRARRPRTRAPAGLAVGASNSRNPPPPPSPRPPAAAAAAPRRAACARGHRGVGSRKHASAHRTTPAPVRFRSIIACSGNGTCASKGWNVRSATPPLRSAARTRDMHAGSNREIFTNRRSCAWKPYIERARTNAHSRTTCFLGFVFREKPAAPAPSRGAKGRAAGSPGPPRGPFGAFA